MAASHNSDKAEKNGSGGVEVAQEFTDIIGGHGRYQMAIFIFCFFCSAPHCFHNLIMTFFAPNVDHWCARPPSVRRTERGIRTGVLGTYEYLVESGTEWNTGVLDTEWNTGVLDTEWDTGVVSGEWNTRVLGGEWNAGVLSTEWDTGKIGTEWDAAVFGTEWDTGEIGGEWDTGILAANISVEEWKNRSLPFAKGRMGLEEPSSCTMYESSARNGSLFVNTHKEPLKCSSWEYDHSFYRHTMVDEWDLVCDREWLISISKTVYMVAFLFAATLCGQMSDKFGRRKTMICCLIIFLIAASLTLLSVNFIMFLVLRFFVALGLTSVFTISYVIMTEIVSLEYRSIYCFTFKYGWVIAYMLMPYIAWHIPNWFWLQMVFTLPCLGLLCIFWVVPETPRWLLTQKRFTELEKVLMFAAEKNGKDITKAKASIHHFISHHPQTEQKKGNETVLDLLKTPALRRNTINIYFCWFIISYIYYALSWNTNDLGGDPYWNFFFCGFVELPSGLIFMFICRYIGHRLGLLIANVLAGLCLLAIIFVPPDMVWLVIFFTMLGKFFNSASFDTVYIYTAEIFPTVVRNVAVGSSSTWARIGALIAPFIRQVADVTHPSVPLAVPGSLSILSGILMLLLPETLGKKVPDTLEEGERFASKQDIHPKAKKQHNGVSNGIEMGER
ncbi:organic cation transporter protein [Caerostris darwini]|uniref:Organic cation transporter protein n=1 Tax=Caerostris darwini TaxID=1538125 RepID=A0AAV4TLD2_9ARAC|nr:organic cation transporter protein [Caerostris darwini]